MRMRAAVVDEVPGEPTIQTVDVSEPRMGEVLIRTVASGVCHSDLHAMQGTGRPTPLPFVPGHEPAGIVEAVGPGVHRVAPGDHVVACPSVFCGHCPACVSGRSWQCSTDEWARGPDEPPRVTRDGVAVTPYTRLGSYAERMLVGQNNVVVVRDDMPLDRACLLGCGVLTGVGAVLHTAQVPMGASVAIVGCGGVGLSVVQGARLANAGVVVAVDLDDEKLALAGALGATATVNAQLDDPVARVLELTGGGADHVFEAIGSASAVQQALAMTGRHGTLTIVGVFDPSSSFTVSGADIAMGKTIRRSIMGSNRFVVDVPMLVEHYLAGRLDLDAMVGSTRSLDDVPQTLRDLEAGRVEGRAVITF